MNTTCASFSIILPRRGKETEHPVFERGKKGEGGAG